jgi:acyl-CoA thioesterase
MTQTVPVITEFVQQMLAGDPGSSVLGIEVLSARDGAASAQMTVLPELANGHGICHGGIVYALADTAFACAANSVAPGTVTADASVVYLSPGRVGELLLAEARVRHRSSRQVFADVTVRSGDRLVADYRGRGALLKPPVGDRFSGPEGEHGADGRQ